MSQVENVTYTGASLVEQKVLGIKPNAQPNFTDSVVTVQGHTQGLSNVSEDSEISKLQGAYNVTKPLRSQNGNRTDSGAEG